MMQERTFDDQRIIDMIQDCVEKGKYELIELNLRERARLLQVFIDRKGGVNLVDCTEISRRISELLRRQNINQDYRIEVSSPGIGREISSDIDLERNTGRFIKVSIGSDEQKKQAIQGYLADFDSESIKVYTDSGLVAVQRNGIEKITGDVDFRTRGSRRGNIK